MAIRTGMFVFEVVVESVQSFVQSRHLIIRSDFADVFSLELKDPKQMHIVIPEPPPLPPVTGKKGKKKKPKPKKKKKEKKGKVVVPPPEPVIQSGQSVLFTSSPEFLIQAMQKFPMEVSLWSKEDNLSCIGCNRVPWDGLFLSYLEEISNCKQPAPASCRDEYNIFEEGTAKLMAKVGLQIRLTYLTEKIISSFRTLSEDPAVRKFLYTGVNSKTTSYICTMKTTDEDFEANSNKIENNYVKAKPALKPIFADYKNAAGANLFPYFNDGDYCCMSHADKPPNSIYNAAETCPDIDFIVDYVRKVIRSCNDNMRMFTPRPAIKPRVKATDIDKLCYCRETNWPDSELAKRFKTEVQDPPCPVCINAFKPEGAERPKFDIANIRGPCGRPDCKVARALKAYVEKLVIEDNEDFDLSDLIGPCGSKDCTLAQKIYEFIKREGDFKEGSQQEGLSTQCACVKQMQDALTKKPETCDSSCSNECEDSDLEPCEGKFCPFNKNLRVYDVFYFTVEYNFEKKGSEGESPGPSSKSSTPEISSKKVSITTVSNPVASRTASTPSTSPPAASIPSKTTSVPTPAATTPHTSPQALSTPPSTRCSILKFCETECPTVKEIDANMSCSKSTCGTSKKVSMKDISKCETPVCANVMGHSVSPADSDIVIRLEDIHNPCCVKSCEVAGVVKGFIAEGALMQKEKPEYLIPDDDPCYCDCDCTLRIMKHTTTYCTVCGGYECLGEDAKNLPDYRKPHPCPVYHKLYDRKKIKTDSPWPEENKIDEDKPAAKKSSTRVKGSKSRTMEEKFEDTKSSAEKKKKVKDTKSLTEKKRKTNKAAKTKKADKPNEVEANMQSYLSMDNAQESKPVTGHKPNERYLNTRCPVPKCMGWLWNSESIPGLKFRPNWKPGAANKKLVRKYKAVREGLESKLKKKRALMNRKKKLEMLPTLVVTKRNGEYTVRMETFKQYPIPRGRHQYPYEENAHLLYTIGKTPEEQAKVEKQRERRERRETRRKSRLLQSTFVDKCQEICVKAYNQAMGLFTAPHPNNPPCACDSVPLKPQTPPIDSCSCSEEGTISSSDTDGDDWTIEFTAPLARWDPKAKHVPVLQDNETQYTYLDYKVKCLDKQGNQVPRFFKGPDGKPVCSDLGGFWSADNVWLEINKDGYIGPDNRWVPQNFIGPDGVHYTSDEGSFVDHHGKLWKIGIDGYVGKDGKWVAYPRKPTRSMSTATGTTVTKKTGSGKSEPGKKGDAAKVGATGKAKLEAKGKATAATSAKEHGAKKSALVPPVSKAMTSKPKKGVSMTGIGGLGKRPLIMNLGVQFGKTQPYGKTPVHYKASNYQIDRTRYMESQKLGRYCEIMNGLKIYDDLCEVKAPAMTNRASNTPRKKVSPFTMDGVCRRNRQICPKVPSLDNRTNTTVCSLESGPTYIS